MVKLVIVESPAKCGKIEKFLGSGYKCCASFGHIRDIKDGLKGINIANNFSPTFGLLANKMKYISRLRREIGKATEVILATDDDREGEAIAWHICQVFNLPINTTKRIIFHEITKTGITHAIRAPTILNMHTVHAQQARQVLDLIVGFRLSPLLWKHVSHTAKSVLSAGRCQTPALRLIYDNQKEINDSPGKTKYDTVGVFAGFPFQLNYHYADREKMETFLEESVSHDHVYIAPTPKSVVKRQPTPFTTSGLQQKASNELHFSPKRTMSVAQKLYEGGYITYMRTDSKTYSADFIKNVKGFITEHYGPKYILKSIHSLSLRKGKDNAQEAHEAIRPTSIKCKTLPNNVDSAWKRLYKLIWENTLESCMSPAIYLSIRPKITAPDERKYLYTSELVDFPGWKVVKGYKKKNKEYDDLLKIDNNTILSYAKIQSHLKLKELKTHYTEARLVRMLEEKGIGRPSTFSSLIAKIQDRSYVQKEDVEGRMIKCVDFELVGDELEEIETERKFGGERNKLVIQPTGVLVMEFLLKHFDPLFRYEYTKQMELNLDNIAKGEKAWHTLCHECYGSITLLSKKIAKNHRESVKIDAYHTYIIGKYGPVIRCDKDGETSFLSVRKNINMEKLRDGKYTLQEIVEESSSGRNLGTYKGSDVLLKKGKYGLYVTCGKKNYSVKHLKKGIERVELADVTGVLSGTQSANPKVLRILREDLSVRKGKWGPYLFYKTDEMTKPKFLKLRGCKLNPVQCGKEDLLAWVLEEYQI